jgi:hypothetical protein
VLGWAESPELFMAAGVIRTMLLAVAAAANRKDLQTTEDLSLMIFRPETLLHPK